MKKLSQQSTANRRAVATRAKRPERRLRIGIDTGGTFTDFVVQDPRGQLHSFKLPSNPKNPAAVILRGIARALEETASPNGPRPALEPLVEVIHGSTVATNALLERKGARTAFLTTEGFADLLFLGRQNRERLYDLNPPPRRFLVAEQDCFGVPERTYFDGEIAKRPSAKALARLRAELRQAGVESLAICFLHGWQHPQNEAAVAEALRPLGLYTSVSHQIAPEFREYERASTTVLNSYVGPLMDRYLGQLEAECGHPLAIMQSNGGLIPASVARKEAVRTILSGPAGGVMGALGAARASQITNVLGFDMGGTSTDVALCQGEPRRTVEAYVDGLPLRVPMLDIHTVGAGGGSLAYVDEGGLLKVGPESAGADPGPACYGKGSRPTVTDAHVVLGHIAAEQLAGGTLHIAPERARQALQPLAAALGLSVEACAEGILRVANANMERAIRTVSVERGYDPRQFALLAFGGGGGLHACDLADALEMPQVVVPAMSGALSALGMLLADRVRDYAAGTLQHTAHEALLQRLEERALADAAPHQPKLERLADLRYQGQSYELTVPWPSAATPAKLAQALHRAHRQAYGFDMPQRAIEVVTLRVRATLASPKVALRHPGRMPAEPAQRMVYLPAESAKEKRGRTKRGSVGYCPVPLYRWQQVPEEAVAGPALVLDYGATVLVQPGWRFRCDAAGNLLLERARAKSKG